jgi:hypothetical protein
LVDWKGVGVMGWGSKGGWGPKGAQGGGQDMRDVTCQNGNEFADMEQKQDALEAAGWHYDRSNGTYSKPGHGDISDLQGALPQDYGDDSGGGKR